MLDSDSGQSSRSRPEGINRRAPATPMEQWRIKNFGQLPDHLKRVLSEYPPFLTTRRAAELNGGGRSKLYQHRDAGYIRSYKSDGSTLWGTESIVFRLANMPEVAASPSRKAPSDPPAVTLAPTVPKPPSSRPVGRPRKAQPAFTESPPPSNAPCIERVRAPRDQEADQTTTESAPQA
jgi:hypothetical protein